MCACDYLGECPYNAMYSGDCAYWCGLGREEEPEDYPDMEEDEN